MKVAIFGTKGLTGELLEHLTNEKVTVDTLVTYENINDHAQIAGFDANLGVRATGLGIRTYYCNNYKLASEADYQFFCTNSFDLGISYGWQRIIPERVLETFRIGVFGWHGSMFKFPNGRGRSPLNWSIRLGGQEIFHNLFKYSPGVDDGPIFETRRILIHDDDYIADLQLKAFESVKSTCVKLVKNIINNNLSLAAQPHSPFILFPELTEQSGLIELGKLDTACARNLVRSCSRPFPGAFVESKDKHFKMRLWRAEISHEEISFATDQNIIERGGVFFLKFRDGMLSSTDFEVLRIRERIPAMVV